MNKKLLIGIIALFVVLVVVAAILRPLAVWLVFWAALIVAWICLTWIVRKKKTKIFHEEMEIKSAERRLKWLKSLLLVGGISLAIFIVGTVLHNVLFALLDKEEEITFFIAVLGGVVLLISNISSIFILITGLRKTT
jgi:hypothetical protein